MRQPSPGVVAPFATSTVELLCPSSTHQRWRCLALIRHISVENACPTNQRRSCLVLLRHINGEGVCPSFVTSTVVLLGPFRHTNDGVACPPFDTSTLKCLPFLRHINRRSTKTTGIVQRGRDCGYRLFYRKSYRGFYPGSIAIPPAVPSQSHQGLHRSPITVPMQSHRGLHRSPIGVFIAVPSQVR